MATIVERPLSALSDLQNNIQGHRRRNSIEVIDVEEYIQSLPSFEPEASTSGSSRGSRPRPRPLPRSITRQPRETISLLDSDEDDDEVTIVSAGPSTAAARPRVRLRSPPPRQVPVVLMPPPVPTIPRRFAGMTSFPMTRNPPPFPRVPSPAPVIADERNFHNWFIDPPEEEPATVTLPRTRRGVPRAAPPSHHTPSMGLGGAIISFNNARAQREVAQVARAATSIRRRSGPHVHRGAASRGMVNALLRGDEDAEPRIRRLSGYENFIRRYGSYIGMGEGSGQPGEGNSQYRPSYTHPGEPEPGFTFDFAPPSAEDEKPRMRFFPPTSANAPIILDDDEPTNSARPSSSTALSFPAVSNTENDSSSVEASQLTALLVCARCLDPLLLNESMLEEEAAQRRVWALRCGHMIDEKCLNELGQAPERPEEVAADPKGKGKAKATQRATYSDAVPELADAVVPANSSIRSRLRSRHVGAADPTTTEEPSLSVESPPAKRRRIAKPKVQAEYEWKCPVATCERVHVSVKMNGIWGPEKERAVGPKSKGGLLGATAALMGVGGKGSDAAKAQARGAIPVFA